MVKKILKSFFKFFKLNFLISDLYEFKQNYLTFKKVDSNDFLRFQKNLIGNNKDLIFDIGANVGEYSENYIRAGAKKVIAVEPQENIYSKLKKKFENNSKVICLKCGVGSKEDKIELYVSDEAHRVSTFSKKQTKISRLKNTVDWNRKELVQVITIENLIKKYGIPSFVKIDVEGYELEVFKGLKTKIPYFQFEFLKKESLDVLPEIFSIINSLGDYEYNMISNLNSKEFLFSNYVSSDFLLSLIRNLNDYKCFGDYFSGDIVVRLKK